MWRPRFTIRQLMLAVAVTALAATGLVATFVVALLVGGLVAYRLGRRQSRLARAASALLWGPVTFLAICLGWTAIDVALGRWEVSRYIEDHQAIVARRLSDPRVHSFSLSHDPDHWPTLLVQFEVDDKTTYEMLESDLSDASSLRFPPIWQTTMRSRERLEGFDLRGLNELGEAFLLVIVAVIAALCVSLTLLVLALCGPRQREGPQERAETDQACVSVARWRGRGRTKLDVDWTC